MRLTINITAVTGSSPYDIYICQSGGTGCFYIDTTNTIPYEFQIPVPYDTSTSYMVKIIDGEGCVITNTQSI